MAKVLVNKCEIKVYDEKVFSILKAYLNGPLLRDKIEVVWSK